MTFKPMHKGYFNNINDLISAYYGGLYNGGMTKASDPILTTTPGIRNTIYGARLWEQLLLSGKMFALLPKSAWDKSGFRAITGMTDGPIGVGENAVLPDATKPEITPVKVDPKVAAVTVEASSLEIDLETKDDSVRWADIIDFKDKEFRHRVNGALCADMANGSAGNNFESVDRIVSSYDEIDMAGLSAGANKVYNISRSAAGWADAKVDSAAAEGTDGTLTLDMLSHLITLCRPYWDDENYGGKMFVTGYDVNERINQLIRAEQRYVEFRNAKITVNGVSTVAGTDAGIQVASYNTIPIFCDAQIPKDTLSRVFLLDPEYLKMAVIQPPQYVETEDYLLLNRMQRKGLFHMSGELVCTKFAGQGKLRDLA